MAEQPEDLEVELDDDALEQAAGGIIAHSGPPLLNVPSSSQNYTVNSTIYFQINP